MGNTMPSTRKTLKGDAIRVLCKKVPDMDVDEIKEVYDDFKKHTKGKNRLTRRDFKKVYKRAFGDKAAPLAEHIFNAFDVNGDGKVNFEEFLVGVSMADNKPNRADRLARLKWAFSVYDADKSGTIDRQEMRSLVKAVFDLSTSQTPAIPQSAEEFADELFDEVDANHDGDITFEEFCKAAEKNESLIDILMPAPDETRVSS